MLSVDDIRKIAQQVAEATMLSEAVGTVGTVTGDATNGYYARLKLGGSAAMTEPVRCLRHYTPVVDDRVLILLRGGRPLYVVGRVN